MEIREAAPNDNAELQALQAQCPQGRTVIVSIVNTPDFFGRVRAYESHKVFVACEEDRIIGSAALAIRQGMVNGELSRIGYQFQFFTSPQHRRQGVAKQLHRQVEDHLIQQGAALSYCLIMEGNLPSMQLVEDQGFRRHRTLIMASLMVNREMEVASRGTVSPVAAEDLGAVARLLNETWQGYDLYEPTSAEVLARFVDRTPGYGFDHLFVLKDQGAILACLGFWDWSQIMRIRVEALSLKWRLRGLLRDVVRRFRPMPRIIKPGEVLRQMMLTPIGFKEPRHLGALLRHINHQALQREIGQIFCVCEKGHGLLDSMKGFTRIETGLHLYIKPLQRALRDDRPVFIDGIDL